MSKHVSGADINVAKLFYYFNSKILMAKQCKIRHLVYNSHLSCHANYFIKIKNQHLFAYLPKFIFTIDKFKLIKA